MLQVVSAKVYNECPTDDFYIYENITFQPLICNVEDKRESEPGVLIIRANNVVVDCNGMVLNGTGINVSEYPRYRFGILSRNYRNVEIKNCVVMNYFDGILMINMMNVEIHNNTLIGNNNGIVLDNTLPYYEEKIEKRNFTHISSSGKNKVYNNRIYKNGQGINLLCSNDNIIFGNEIIDSIQGILGDCSSGNRIIGNKILDALKGIRLTGNSTRNIIAGNVILTDTGLFFEHSKNNIVANNIFKKTSTAIGNSQGNILFNNYYVGKDRDEYNFFGDINLDEFLKEKKRFNFGWIFIILALIFLILSIKLYKG
jgi:parallel beta-helix repeat protein